MTRPLNVITHQTVLVSDGRQGAAMGRPPGSARRPTSDPAQTRSESSYSGGSLVGEAPHIFSPAVCHSLTGYSPPQTTPPPSHSFLGKHQSSSPFFAGTRLLPVTPSHKHQTFPSLTLKVFSLSCSHCFHTFVLYKEYRNIYQRSISMSV